MSHKSNILFWRGKKKGSRETIDVINRDQGKAFHTATYKSLIPKP